MPTAFGDQADFRLMTTSEHLSLDDVIHQANVTVDEKGTVAAAKKTSGNGSSQPANDNTRATSPSTAASASSAALSGPCRRRAIDTAYRFCGRTE